jgi:anti-sigma-K factor RskA
LPEHAPHPDLGAHATGGLEPAEAAALERHLEVCAHCRDEWVRLRATALLVPRAAPPFPVPRGLERRTLDALADEEPAAPPLRRRRPARAVVAALAAAAVLMGGLVVVARNLDSGPAGTLELDADLRSVADPSLEASATVRATPLGRTVALDSDTLPVLPGGRFYELWFVGPGDSPASPNRISCGTFHPDESGRTHVMLHAAADPARYPTLSITAEAGDGDPAPGPEVLSAREP